MAFIVVKFFCGYLDNTEQHYAVKKREREIKEKKFQEIVVIPLIHGATFPHTQWMPETDNTA